MKINEILQHAEQAAMEAVVAQFGAKRPTPENAAGEYYRLVFDATVASLQRHINGSY